jgi:ABC-type nitrate/sulfonate/bicarbonate transport system ATPase subunit
MISAQGLQVTLDGKKILADVSFNSVHEGVVAVMGPSGCGKSTLLKALMGIHRFDAGELRLNDKAVPAGTWTKSQSFFSLVPQVPLLLPWRTIEQNVALAADPSVPPDRVTAGVRELLKVVGLSDALNLYPWQVSQGMAARASLARTLMIKADVLLLDEPFAAIDATTRFKLQCWLLETISALKIEAFIVTHDPREAIILADEIIILGGKPAKVAQKLTCPPRSLRRKPEWLFGRDAGELERQIRDSLAGL